MYSFEPLDGDHTISTTALCRSHFFDYKDTRPILEGDRKITNSLADDHNGNLLKTLKGVTIKAEPIR